MLKRIYKKFFNRIDYNKLTPIQRFILYTTVNGNIRKD